MRGIEEHRINDPSGFFDAVKLQAAGHALIDNQRQRGALQESSSQRGMTVPGVLGSALFPPEIPAETQLRPVSIFTGPESWGRKDGGVQMAEALASFGLGVFSEPKSLMSELGAMAPLEFSQLRPITASQRWRFVLDVISLEYRSPNLP